MGCIVTKAIDFLAPRMVGERFSGHAIPLEVLKDLAVLEEMVIEVAKWHYYNKHPNRKRLPRGFTDSISVKLTEINEGSAVAKLVLYVALTLLPLENQECYEKARNSIINAVNAAQFNEAITQHLPANLLGYFDRIGRSLRQDEAMEFNPADQARPASLNRETRKKLLCLSQERELTEEVLIRGQIPEFDQEKATFTLLLKDGQRISAAAPQQHFETIMEAFNGFLKGGKVSIQGVGRFNRMSKLQTFDTIEHLNILDPLDVGNRLLDELGELGNGWFNGKGSAFPKAGLQWLTNVFTTFYDDSLPLPRLYPTVEGKVQAEWSTATHEISLEICLLTKNGELQIVSIADSSSDDHLLQLDVEEDWHTLNDLLKPMLGSV